MQKGLDSKFYAVFDEVYLAKWISVVATGLHVVHLFWACIATGTYNTQELPCRWSPGPHMFKVYSW